MVIKEQFYVERLLNIGHWAFNVQYYAVGVPGGHVEPVSLSKRSQGFVILFGGSKPLSELIGGDEFMEICARGIVEALEEGG